MKLSNPELTRKIEKISPLIELNNFLQKVNVPTRYRGVIIDQFSIVFVLMIICLPLLLFVIYTTIKYGQPALLKEHVWTSIYACLAPAIYFNKDILLGQSIGKRICALQVTDRKTGEPATPFKCLIRNLTLFFWPIELVVILITRNRRLGDFIANTETTIFTQSSDTRIPWSQIIIFILLTSAFFWFLQKTPIIGSV